MANRYKEMLSIINHLRNVNQNHEISHTLEKKKPVGEREGGVSGGSSIDKYRLLCIKCIARSSAWCSVMAQRPGLEGDSR